MTTATQIKLTRDELREIESKLLSHKNAADDWDEEYTWSIWAWEADDVEVVQGLGSVRVMDTYKGGEGGGDSPELVFEITPEDGRDIFYVHMSGYYSSYDGTEWDGDLTQVKPVQVMVTKYQAV